MEDDQSTQNLGETAEESTEGLTAEEEVLKQDDDEWDEFMPDEESAESSSEDEDEGGEGEDKGEPVSEGESAAPVAKEPVEDPGAKIEDVDTSQSEMLSAAQTLAQEREIQESRTTIEEDVRKKLFSDKPSQILDADGDPIETVADVMQLRNPMTGENFTAEEAASWLLQAQSHLDKTLKETDAEVAKIVDVNLGIKYDLQEVQQKYGQLFSDNPGIRKQVTDAYEKTLEIGSDGDTIVGQKLGLKEFFDLALEPALREYEFIKDTVEKQKSAEGEGQAQAAAQAKIQTKAKAEQQKQKQKQNISEREDIHSNTGPKAPDAVDPEDKEWNDMAKEYYEENK